LAERVDISLHLVYHGAETNLQSQILKEQLQKRLSIKSGNKYVGYLQEVKQKGFKQIYKSKTRRFQQLSCSKVISLQLESQF